MGNKIGIGIITCNRPDFFKKCLESIPMDQVDHVVVINDGDKLDSKYLDIEVDIIEHDTNQGVGKSKNNAFKYLLDKNCDHIFLIEDDIIIKDDGVFNAYIDASKETGIQHFMFGYHGPANKGGVSKGQPKPRKVIEYPSGLKINLNQHCVGAFCYYSRVVLDDVGLMDEAYVNAFEHVDHSYMIAKKNYCTPYWWWPDISNSMDYLDESECSEFSSIIRPRSDWQENISMGAKHFMSKHDYSPAWINSVPDTNINDLLGIIKNIKKELSCPAK